MCITSYLHFIVFTLLLHCIVSTYDCAYIHYVTLDYIYRLALRLLHGVGDSAAQEADGVARLYHIIVCDIIAYDISVCICVHIYIYIYVLHIYIYIHIYLLKHEYYHVLFAWTQLSSLVYDWPRPTRPARGTCTAPRGPPGSRACRPRRQH